MQDDNNKDVFSKCSYFFLIYIVSLYLFFFIKLEFKGPILCKISFTSVLYQWYPVSDPNRNDDSLSPKALVE